MRVIFSFILSFLFFGQAPLVRPQSLPLYQLPERIPAKQEAAFYQHPLVATESGLYEIVGANTPVPLWTGGRVTNIERVVIDGAEKWFFVTEKGLYTSANLRSFVPSGEQLPHLVIKEYEAGKTQLSSQAQTLKGMAIHPEKPLVMVSATKDYVFLTRDGGKTWKNLGYSAKSSGTKAVAVANLPAANGRSGASELVVFLSHAFYGLSYIKPDDASPRWIDIVSGFEKMPTLGYADEISSILPVLKPTVAGGFETEIYFAQTFIPSVYRLNWDRKIVEKIYQGSALPDTIDGLVWTGNNLLFTRPGGMSLLNTRTNTAVGEPAELQNWIRLLQKVPEPVYSMYIPKNLSGFADGLVLKELWLLKPQTVYSPYGDFAADKKSLYMPANRAATVAGINQYIDLTTKNKLDSIVIDMKDDYGLLRYKSKDPFVQEKSYVSQYAANIEDFVARFKAKNIYLIARIVVFKDKHLAQIEKGKYAVWNSRTSAPWTGIKGTTQVKDESGAVIKTQTEYYDEAWVDPYSEEVWEYNIRIAQELIKAGFDEIQFDYIRFPTDGVNLYQAEYRWKNPGMDMEGALISFLKYARKNIQAPIGIDVYGANGWYRSGARTGQDVEMLADYVDIICPMLYPSHFEQPFLAHSPADNRPYRIYYFGSYRNTIIVRNKAIVRPWVQAFYLGVSYDRAYYNPTYVTLETFGVYDSINRGFMYWNNGGRYEDITPGAPDEVEFPGKERGLQTPFRK